MNIKIAGSGSYIPTNSISNFDFANHQFLNEDGTNFKFPNEIIIRKFRSITGINTRKYLDKNLLTSDIGYYAAKKAIDDAKVNPENIDYIIFAHNFGNLNQLGGAPDLVPSLASRVKYSLQIANPKCVAYDMIFGCPGWIEGVIQATAFIKSGMAKTVLVIGAESLSRVSDPHDRDSMIYADGAGAVIIQATDEINIGILSHETASFTLTESKFLFCGKSYNKSFSKDNNFIKMNGRKIYEFALSNVPQAMKDCLDKSGVEIHQIKKIIIHQANEKMDEAIVDRFYKLFETPVPQNIMPMTIYELGNSSVATIPTLYDLLVKNELPNHSISKGDFILFASVGAGMNINAIVYQY